MCRCQIAHHLSRVLVEAPKDLEQHALGALKQTLRLYFTEVGALQRQNGELKADGSFFNKKFSPDGGKPAAIPAGGTPGRTLRNTPARQARASRVSYQS